jgi:glutamine amidotransferase
MSIKRVGIVDYQMGNLFSVRHACSAVGLQPEIINDADSLREYDALILPGVGAFGAAMANLDNLGLSRAIHEFIATGRPFLGICLGLQLLLSSSEEFGSHRGLDIIPGTVIRFPQTTPDGDLIRIPQIGWNAIRRPPQRESWETTPLTGLSANTYMYFVHSFYAAPKSPDHVLCLTDYEGVTYCSGVLFENVLAFQFHPEKSGREGISIYNNWARAT